MFLLSVFAVGIGVGIDNQRRFGQTHRSAPTVQIVYSSQVTCHYISGAVIGIAHTFSAARAWDKKVLCIAATFWKNSRGEKFFAPTVS